MRQVNRALDTPESRLALRGLTLPDRAPRPIGNFRNVMRIGSLLYVSGQGPVEAGGGLKTGKVGGDVTAEEARLHAELVGLNLLAVLKDYLGDLAEVRQVIKIFGMVNAVPDFTDHPHVVNGCSDLLCSILGERGIHARSAIGVGSLPNNITVEIEAIVEAGT
ncbi:RidA family protein [Chelativorans alearense]|uniref:RidA family protein n=1 Tax=Chelativorans alearense TaxID=2681495 RepID=UPI0013D6EBE9|nr:RidA family protein [Chelativorans alearense]